MSVFMYASLCSFENLELAFKGARKGKTLKPYVIEFEEKIEDNLRQLQTELLFQTYRPKPLETFILRDPKTRKISKSDFRDRIVHHAIFNIIEPLFEKKFIVDSFANRKGKGTLKSIQRFEVFARKVSKNYSQQAYVLKADIRHYTQKPRKLLTSVMEMNGSGVSALWVFGITKILREAAIKPHPLGLG